MSNGYLIAAEADRAAAYDLADGFGLEPLTSSVASVHDAAAIASAANVGIVLSLGAAQDAAFTTLVRALASQLRAAQLILIEPEARAAFAFLPEAWPSMSFALAHERATELSRRRQASAGATEPPHAAPLPPVIPPAETAPPTPEPKPAPEQLQQTQQQQQQYQQQKELPPSAEEPAAQEHAIEIEDTPQAIKHIEPSPDETPAHDIEDRFGAEAHEEAEEQAPVAAAPPATEEPAPAPAAPIPAPPQYSAPPEPAEPPPLQSQASNDDGAASAPLKKTAPASRSAAPAATASAPADATAFAPKKVRRGTPELVRVAIHQPKDLKAVIKAARQIDPRTEPAPQGMSIGNVALGASVGVSLEVRGAVCDGTVQRRTWRGDPIDFNFSIEAEADVKQIVVLARVFIDDAQIGVLAFTRPAIGADKKQQGIGDKVRLKRHKRVFLSYSSKDRETVSAIATAYSSAGVAHFWDRTSLQSGEEWSPRLRKEIERADLFHLCWSKSAAASEWVEKEASYALTRRRRAKKPDITVQMLDGPPWAKHPDSLDSINFDDFVRAAIVGYARGDGET